MIFTELRELRRLGQRTAAVEIGSRHQTFNDEPELVVEGCDQITDTPT